VSFHRRSRRSSVRSILRMRLETEASPIGCACGWICTGAARRTSSPKHENHENHENHERHEKDSLFREFREHPRHLNKRSRDQEVYCLHERASCSPDLLFKKSLRMGLDDY